MIELTTGDVLTANTEALVNTVNCVGYMGRGVALQFKRAFPENFKSYEAACRRGEVQPGRMFIYETGRLAGPKYIINFPTKRHWRGKSRMADIVSGLDALVADIKRLGIQSIAIPPLGSGLGGLHWSDVRSRIVEALGDVPVRAVVFEPIGAPDTQAMARSTDVPRMTPGRAALVGLIDRYLGGLMDTSITLLEIHKLMYFLQESGELTKLKYVKAPYGPYAENLRQVLSRIEGHFTSGYADGGDAPDKRIEIVPGSVDDASEYLGRHPATLARFDRVSRLVDGFETPFGLELLATVHWVVQHEAATTLAEVVEGTHRWNERKRQFSSEQIRIAYDVLRDQGWVEAPVAG